MGSHLLHHDVLLNMKYAPGVSVWKLTVIKIEFHSSRPSDTYMCQ